MNDEIELESISSEEYLLSLGNTVYINGKLCKIERIYLIRDGHGPNGYYDRIHIIVNGVIFRSCPAHSVEYWDYKV